MALTEKDFLTRVLREELDELVLELVESGQADPLAMAINSAEAEIAMSVDPTLLPADMLYRLRLSLSVPLLYLRRTVVPEKHEKEQTWARGLLKDILKGLYPNLLPANPTAVAGTGSWGSKPKICT